MPASAAGLPPSFRPWCLIFLVGYVVWRKVSFASRKYLVGVRKSALLPPDDGFHILLNRQEICEKDETLGRLVVDDLEAAVPACQRMPGCSRFAFFTVSAAREFPTNTVFLCSGASRAVSAAGWIAGIVPAAIPPQKSHAGLPVASEPGPVVF